MDDGVTEININSLDSKQHNASDSSSSSDTDKDRELGLSKTEIQRRKRAVRASKALFRTIDVLFNLSQNICPYVSKADAERIELNFDVAYDEGFDVCKLDIYKVPGESAQPAIILIHGGGFSAGDKKYRRGLSQFFALNGFTVFCVNYGLSPDFVFPDPYNHLVTAANFVYRNAEKYNILPDKILVSGDSAGAYYASMLAVNNCSDVFAREFGAALDFKICGTLLNCGVYDMNTVLNTKYFLDVDDGVFLSITGLRRSELDKFKYKDVCMPYEYITSEYPPSFLISSDNDVFCKGQSASMIERLNSLGVYNEHYVARHKSSIHCFSLNWRGEDAYAANELMLSFAKRLVNDRIKL